MDIYVPHHERAALSAVDLGELDELLEKAVEEGRSGCLNKLKLGSCGSYVASRLLAFERALSSHREARSSQKRDQTASYLRSVKHELSFSVRSMQRRIEEEMQDEDVFYVQGELTPPYRFGQRLTATVSFRWRKTADDDWKRGSVTFTHDVDPFARHRLLAPERKLSARKQQEEEQRHLSDTWEHLMRGALYSVRDYFKDGGDGGAIPASFAAKTDDSGYLNNHSTVFWTKKT
jgi:hypothetical protein